MLDHCVNEFTVYATSKKADDQLWVFFQHKVQKLWV